MIYQDWAPKGLVELLLNLEQSKVDFQSEEYKKNDLEQYAQDQGYLCWKDFDATKSLQIDILKRLLTRMEMIPIWEWVEMQNFSIQITANGGMIGNFLNKIEEWNKAAKQTRLERESDFKEIAHHAKSLSRLLKKYSGENQAFSTYSTLIPSDYDQQLKQMLHPNLVSKIEKKPHYIRFLWMRLLPPINVILERLKNSAKESTSELSSNFPTKINANNAFRTYLINVLVDYFLKWTGEAKPTIIATFMSVALDDASINADTIRKSASNLEWEKYLLEDFR